MNRYFLTTESGFAPIAPDRGMQHIEAKTPCDALQKLISAYRHPFGLRAAWCFLSEDAWEQGQAPLAELPRAAWIPPVGGNTVLPNAIKTSPDGGNIVVATEEQRELAIIACDRLGRNDLRVVMAQDVIAALQSSQVRVTNDEAAGGTIS